MKTKPRTKQELLVDYAITKTAAMGLIISLTILWDRADWTTEGLEEFIDYYWDWIEAYNKHDESVQLLVQAMKEATGIEVRI